MRKPDSIRAALVSALPQLARDPANLAVFIDRGRIAARIGRSAGYEWRYRLNLVLLDFTGDPDLVMIAVMQWIEVNQPELLLNHPDANEAISFEADIIDASTIDLSIEIELNEAVSLVPRDGGGFDAVHLAEPMLAEPIEDVPAGTMLGAIWIDGVQLIPGQVD